MNIIFSIRNYERGIRKTIVELQDSLKDHYKQLLLPLKNLMSNKQQMIQTARETVLQQIEDVDKVGTSLQK